MSEGGRADVRRCGTPEQVTAHLPSPAHLGMTEGCASQRHALDKETSAFIRGGWEQGSLSNPEVPGLASGSSQRQPVFTSWVLGIVASPICPLGLPGMFGALLTFFPSFFQPHPPLNSENTLIQHRGLDRCQVMCLPAQGHPVILTLLISL